MFQQNWKELLNDKDDIRTASVQIMVPGNEQETIFYL